MFPMVVDPQREISAWFHLQQMFHLIATNGPYPQVILNMRDNFNIVIKSSSEVIFAKYHIFSQT